MRLSHALGSIATLALAIVLANCGGGGHAAVVPGAAAGGTATAPPGSGTQNITISINIPGSTASSSTRKAAYVGLGTKSATFSAQSVVVAPPTAAPTAVPTPSATAASNCTTTCTATLKGVPVGMVAFTVNLYDEALSASGAAQGNVLSVGSATVAITSTTQTVNLTFNGTPVTVQLTPATNPIPNPSPMATVSAMVAMNVLDADGNVIVGAASPSPAGGGSPTPVPLSNPYTFTTSQSADVTLSPATVGTTGQVLTLSYDGKLPAGTLVELYSQNAGINNNLLQTAGSILIGAAAVPSPGPTSTPTVSPSAGPTSLVAGTFPIIFTNSSGISGNINVYVYGLSPADDVTGEYLTSRTSGALATFPPTKSTIPSNITLPSTGGEVDVPMLCGARIYVAIGGSTLNIGVSSAGVVPPAPWTVNDPGINQIWETLEYTWTNYPSAPANCPDTAMGLDQTSVDEIGIPLSLELVQAGALPVGPVGLMPYAGSNVALGLNALGAPWSSLIQTYTTPSGALGRRIINPTHTLASLGQVPPPPFNFPPTYLAAYMQSLCTTYSSTDLVIGGNDPVTHGQFITGYPEVYGRYSGTCGDPTTQTLTFYSQPDGQGTTVATFPGVPSTVDALGNAGYFAPPSAPTGSPILQIGRALSVSIVRSTFSSANPSLTQPDCTSGDFYGGSATNHGTIPTASVTTNWYSALAHAYAYSNSVYAFADDDECSIYAPYINAPAGLPAPGTAFVVTINPF